MKLFVRLRASLNVNEYFLSCRYCYWDRQYQVHTFKAKMWRNKFHRTVSCKTIFLIIILINTCLLLWYAGTHSEKTLRTPETLPQMTMNPARPSEIIKRRNEEKCDHLIQIAKDILDGREIPLPHSGGNNTLWKFKERLDSSEMVRRINLFYPHSKELRENAGDLFQEKTNEKYKIAYVVFTHNCCEKSKVVNIKDARAIGGFDDIRSFNMSDLSPKFIERHKGLISVARGAGFWFWKPYIILRTLIGSDLVPGDVVLYVDADMKIFDERPRETVQLAHDSVSGVITIGAFPYTEVKYSKRDAYVLMDMDIPEIRETPQRGGGFVAVKKNCYTIQFVMEWLAYMSDRRISSDDPNTLGFPNYPGFRGNRNDQTALSLLAKKWGVLAMDGLPLKVTGLGKT